MLAAGGLRPLEPLVEEVRDEAGEQDGAQDEYDGRESPHDQRHVVRQFQQGHWFFAAGWRRLDHSKEVLKRPEAKRAMVVDAEGEGEAEEALVVLGRPVGEENNEAAQGNGRQDPDQETNDLLPRVDSTPLTHAECVRWRRVADHRGKDGQPAPLLGQCVLRLVVQGLCTHGEGALHMLLAQGHVLQ